MTTIDGSKLVACTDLASLQENLGKEVTMNACIHKIKDMGGFAFVMLRTARYVFQAVYNPESCAGELKELREGAYAAITGLVAEEPRANNGLEIRMTGFTLLSTPAAEYPLQVNAWKLPCNLDANLKYRSTALRNPKERAIFRIAEGVCTGFRNFLLEQGFTEIHTPKIVAQGAEGGANIFKLKYFGKDCYLAQSPQFYKQTCVAAFDRVFEVAPVYRAEKHNSPRHLNEYIGLDFEMAYIQDMTDVMNMETAMLKYVMEYLKAHYENEIKITGAKIPEITSIPSVTFLEAIEMTGASSKKHDLDPEDERKVCDIIREKTGSEFVFITHFPALKRPFYAMDNPEDPRVAESFDLLFRGLEITTGGQRIHDYHEQVAKMERMKMDPALFESYLQIHKYGMPPHGGLGLGLERVVMQLIGLPNVRYASLFPRDINHVDP